jgi:transcriptional regulator with PAS, ATPase and Fis domain
MRSEQLEFSTDDRLDRAALRGANGDHRYAEQAIFKSNHPIVGNSPSIRRCLDMAKKAANSGSTVLLLGESGTGKEIFARAIHHWSERKNYSFVAINCVG